MNVVLVTGGFDPIHSGHIQYFKRAKELGDVLIVGVNSDEWLTRKKGRPFMNINERMRIVSELRVVDYVIRYNDDDNSSCMAIKQTRELFPDAKNNCLHGCLVAIVVHRLQILGCDLSEIPSTSSSVMPATLILET